MSENEDRARDALRESKREVVDALTQRDIKDLHDELETLRKQVKALEDERNNAMRWALFAIGTALVALAGWVAAQFMQGRLR